MGISQENKLPKMIIDAASQSTGTEIPTTTNIQGSAEVLAASLTHFIDLVGGHFPSTLSPDQRFQRFVRDLLVEARRSSIHKIHEVGSGLSGVVYVYPSPLSLDVENGDPKGKKQIDLDTDERIMLGYLAAKTQEKIRRQTIPQVTRQDIENASGGAFSTNIVRSRLFDPLQEAGVVTSSNDGYLLQTSLKDLKKSLLTSEYEAQVKVTSFEKWQNDEFGNTLIPIHLVPTIRALIDLSQHRSANDRIERGILSEKTGKSIGSVRNDLAALKGYNLIAQGIRSKGLLVADLSAYLTIMAANFDSPAVDVKVIDPAVPTDTQVSDQTERDILEITKSPDTEKNIEANPFLVINIETHRDYMTKIADLNRNPEVSHRPSALNHRLRRLDTMNERGQFPWRELISLGLAVEHNRDNHNELYPVGALIALYFSQEEVAQAARLIANGTKGAIEVISTHTHHILSKHLGQIEGKAMEADQKEKMVKFLKGSTEVLKRLDLICQCTDCRKLSN